MNSIESASVAEIWFMIAGRIAPELCCRYPGPAYLAFKQALREVSRKDGDIDGAVSLLREVLSVSPPGGMVFDQAGQLLNVIGWRIRYHPEWFSPGCIRRRMHPGRCGPHVAHAYALMQAAVDEDALDLTLRIVQEGVPGSDDIRMARLIRASIHICLGDLEAGEDELRLITDHPG
ncbi:MAG: hypothetical protein LUQ07_04080 [Methanospirillum sp.]|nr:hypothetical protein [Methanospirillum sp.]